MNSQQTEWNKAYIKGTLRKPTNLDKLYPEAPTEPLANAQPYSYLDELGKWLGRTIGLVAIVATVGYLLGALK